MRAVASLPASSRAKTTTGAAAILVEGQGEERHLQRRIGEADRAARERRERRVADPDAGLDVGRRGAQHDELRAAEVEEVVQRHDRHPRRFEPHLEVAGDWC